MSILTLANPQEEQLLKSGTQKPDTGRGGRPKKPRQEEQPQEARGPALAPQEEPLPTGAPALLWCPSEDERALLRLVLNDFDAATQVLKSFEARGFADETARLLFGACRAVWSDAVTYAALTPLSLASYCQARAVESELGSETLKWSQAAEIVELELATLPKGTGDAMKEALTLSKRLGAAPAFEFFTLDDLENIPGPDWLIRGVLREKTISVLSADTGSFKSFLALDMALSIATGAPFYGREVKPGAVVYVAAEGFWTLRDRATAWLQTRGMERPKNFHILRVPLNVSDPATVAAFGASVAGFRPAFVVLDTLSQCAIGLNENANDEMARFVAGMASLGVQSGAHVQTVHHNAKGSGQYRGAGAIKANVDTHISLERPESDTTNTVFVRCEKQRGAPFVPFALRGDEVVLPYSDEYGDVVTSLVFHVAGAGEIPEKTAPRRVDKTRERLLGVFDEIAAEWSGEVKSGTWKQKAEDAGICAGGAFYRHRDALVSETGPILCDGNIYRRKVVTPTSPTSPTLDNGRSGSDGTNRPLNLLPLLPPSLEVGEVGVNGGSAGNGSNGSSAKSRKAKAAAESEPYRATSNGS